MKITTKALILLAAMATGISCSEKGIDQLNKVEKDRFIVKTAKVEKRSIEDTITIVGSVKAFDEAVLYPRVNGKLLKNVLKEGDRVYKNQTVALIERDEPGVVYEAAPVPSTLSGVIGRVYQDSGANVTTQTPIALVVSQEKVRVVVEVPERYVGKVRIGQSGRIKVDAYPDSSFTGKVYRISPVVDKDTRSSVVELLADNSHHKLKSGMFSEVKLIVGAKENVPTVPTSAIIVDNKQSYVFKPVDDKALRLAVSVGLSNEDYAQIIGGVNHGDDVIISGLYGLKDGSKIAIENN
ncbi:MAG: efflux RND transporter periplasmic adaptor subunit [Elusimicrobiales bacterium]|nr:efflux RND transporter periplasmic adaptor subunit [Elusimicrobiales bacterium]